MPHTMRRRVLGTVVHATLWLGLASALGGCGFQLQGTHTMAFQTVQLTGFAGNSPLASELAHALQANGVRVVDSTLSATQAASATQVPITHIVLDGMRDKRGMAVSTTTAYGQVRDVTASNSLRFRVLRGDGSVLLPPTDVALSRDMSYNETNALAKQDESEALYKAMQSDIVSQVMRRLAAIRPDQLQTPPAPPAPAQPVTLSEWEAAREAAREARAATSAASGAASGVGPAPATPAR
jgi:LPS-assembly lipoprotein